jgi:hypothetical protein
MCWDLQIEKISLSATGTSINSVYSLTILFLPDDKIRVNVCFYKYQFMEEVQYVCQVTWDIYLESQPFNLLGPSSFFMYQQV